MCACYLSAYSIRLVRINNELYSQMIADEFTVVLFGERVTVLERAPTMMELNYLEMTKSNV